MNFRPSLRFPLVFLSVGALSALAPLACSSEPGFGDGQAQCNNPALEDECGKSCESTRDCVEGLFCDDDFGTCQAECVAGEEESDDCGGRACNDDGKCVGSGSGGSGGGGINIGQGGENSGTGNTGNNPECIDLQVDFEPQIPNVVLLIDRSGSMNDENGFGAAVNTEITAGTYAPWGCPQNTSNPPDHPNQQNANWRWNVVRNVLFNPDAGVVKPLEEQVRFGLGLYDSNSGFGTSGNNTCPRLRPVSGGSTFAADFEIGFGRHEEMLAAMACNDIGGDTPTRESLTALATLLDAADLDGPKVIVLATDGEPDNCTCPNWTGSGGCDFPGSGSGSTPSDNTQVERGGVTMTRRLAEQYDVVQEAKRIHDDLGITVHVIDVSRPPENDPNTPKLREHLTEVATAGGGDIFDGLNPSNLTAAFQTIIDGVRSCAIDLDGEIAPGKESTGTVTLNGEKLKLNDPNGWRVNTPTQIELRGEACETIKSGAQALDISFPCGSFLPPGPK